MSRPAPRGSKAWKGVRGSFQEYLTDTKQGLPGALQSPDGAATKEYVQDAADERLLEKVISAINKDTAEGRHMYERWERAQKANREVVQLLRQNARRAGPPGRASREAAKAFFPEQWCNLLSEDAVLAELIVDVLATRVVDEFLHDATQLLEAKEGWYLPKPKKRHYSCPQNVVTSSERQPALDLPGLPPRWRQQLNRHREGSQSLSSLDAPEANRTLKHFRSQRPLEAFMTRLQTFTDSQRPQRGLKAPPRDPLAPKWSFPVMAENFPAEWNRIAPATRRVDEKRAEADEAPPGYSWLHRQAATCDVSLLQTGFDLEAPLLDSRLEDELQSLDDRMEDLGKSFESAENETERYKQQMNSLPTLPSRALLEVDAQMDVAYGLRQDSILANSTVISRFDDWCKSHSDIALAFLSFAAFSVLIALCIPCGLAPIQVAAWLLSEEKPRLQVTKV